MPPTTGNIRPAEFSDIMPIAQILEGVAFGKAIPHACRNRANAMVKRARSPRKEALCLVAVGGEGDVRGFIYAEAMPAFDLLPTLPLMVVPYLVGRHCARPLLRGLRSITKRRILVTSWATMGRQAAMSRLLRSEGFKPVATVHHS